MEPTTGIEPVDLFLTKEALYRLSYVGTVSVQTTRRSTEVNAPKWSGRRGSNSRHSAWKADALPTELLPPKSRTKRPPRRPMTNQRGIRQSPSDLERDLTHAGSYVVDLRPRNQPRGSPTTNSHIGWWWGEDSNLRRLRRQIYSLFPLAAREPHRHVLNLGASEGTRTPDPLITNQ